MKSFWLVFVFILIPLTWLHAEEELGGWNHIARITILPDGFFVYPVDEQKFSCPDNYVYIVKNDNKQKEELLRWLTIAFEKNLWVRISIDGCEDGIPELVGVTVKGT